jgi:hypothetical protein
VTSDEVEGKDSRLRHDIGTAKEKKQTPNAQHPTPNVQFDMCRMTSDPWSLINYLGATEATIFSKRGSPRSGSQ